MADAQLKVAPTRDEVQVGLGLSAGQAKVELDLDDAPFLAPEKVDPPAAPAPAVKDAGDAGKPAPAPRKKRLLLLAGVAVLAVVGIAVWWFFLRTPPPPPPEPPKPEVIVVPSNPVPQGPVDYVKNLEPFLVPHADGTGAVRFLVCKFSILSHEPQISSELDLRMLPLRDAIYFYLRSKDSAWLMDARNGVTIKTDLTAVVNEYLTRGEIEDILFDSYLNE